jgi:hypothetical protein
MGPSPVGVVPVLAEAPGAPDDEIMQHWCSSFMLLGRSGASAQEGGGYHTHVCTTPLPCVRMCHR